MSNYSEMRKTVHDLQMRLAHKNVELAGVLAQLEREKELNDRYRESIDRHCASLTNAGWTRTNDKVDEMTALFRPEVQGK
jgi:hypothetical protein